MDTPVEYHYHDTAGRLRYTIVRFGRGPTKHFRVFGPRGGELPTPLPERQRLLYRLPELLRADTWETVHLCERELDTEVLRDHGLIATTMPFGTRGGWLTSYNVALGGRHVVILPDNDGPGRRHAKSVYERLAGAASKLVLELGGSSGLDDVATWFERRANAASELRQRILKARYQAAGLQARHPPIKRTRVELVRRCQFDTLTKLLLLFLIEQNDEPVRMPVRAMAEQCNAHRVTVQRALKALCRVGVLPPGGVPERASEIRWDLLAAMCPIT